MARARRTANQVAPAATADTVASSTARPCEPGWTVPWDMTAPVLWELITEPSDSHDIIAPAEAAEPMEKTDANDDTEPRDRAEPTEPILSTEPTEPMESSDPSEASDHFDVDMAATLRRRSTPMRGLQGATVRHHRGHPVGSCDPTGAVVGLLTRLGGILPAATASRSLGLNPR